MSAARHLFVEEKLSLLASCAVGKPTSPEDAATTAASANQKLRPRQPDGRGDEKETGNHGFPAAFW
ncbi:MAG TPA: hypothetical protein DDW50_14970 [Firmicutes bacterium]|nr:hypothetical protein [Bacillota bacterium]